MARDGRGGGRGREVGADGGAGVLRLPEGHLWRHHTPGHPRRRRRHPPCPHRAHGLGRLTSPLPSPIPISVSLCLMRRFSSGRIPTPQSSSPNLTNFFVWREFVWGAIAGAFGEGMLHPIDTLKTRLQSQAIITGTKAQKNIFQMVRIVWTSVGLRGFYRGISPGVTGSFATGATYFGVIESTKTWLENANPNLSGHWSHFIARGIGDTLGSFIYVPCEVMKQRMQVQGTRKSWASTATKGNICKTPGTQMYWYYNGMFHAGCSSGEIMV